MAVRGIARRWIINSLTVIVLVLVALVAILSIMMQQYVYNSIQSQLKGRSEEAGNLFSSYSNQATQEFSGSARNYIESFTAKNEMEVMAINLSGKVFITSTGFAPDNTQPMPDYQEALEDESNFGVWMGNLNSGEKVMAVTKVIRNSNGGITGALRYVVSMEKADRQILLVVGLLVLGCLLIIAFIIFSNLYFMNSIVMPIRQIGATAKRIAQGDFNARIKKPITMKSASYATILTIWRWNWVQLKR